LGFNLLALPRFVLEIAQANSDICETTMMGFQKYYLRLFNLFLRLVSWVWIVGGSLGALMSLSVPKDRFIGALVSAVVLALGILIRRSLPLTPKHLAVFGFSQEQD
jgi:hypothetical protein